MRPSAICHTRRRRQREGDGIAESIRHRPIPLPRWGTRTQEGPSLPGNGRHEKAPTHLSVPHCTAPDAHWSSRGWNADIMQPETHSTPFIGRNQARFPKLSRFPGRGNDGESSNMNPRSQVPSHAPQRPGFSHTPEVATTLSGCSNTTRDSCVLEVSLGR
jgi:hypothetical protein